MLQETESLQSRISQANAKFAFRRRLSNIVHIVLKVACMKRVNLDWGLDQADCAWNWLILASPQPLCNQEHFDDVIGEIPPGGFHDRHQENHSRFRSQLLTD